MINENELAKMTQEEINLRNAERLKEMCKNVPEDIKNWEKRNRKQRRDRLIEQYAGLIYSSYTHPMFVGTREDGAVKEATLLADAVIKATEEE